MIRTVGRILAVVGALALIAIAAGAAAGLAVVRRGLSARAQPTRVEEFLALRMRSLATPAAVRDLPNPLPASETVLAGARHHFADHCASCHANDGSGATEMGKNLYPKAPDLRAPRTQGLTDGELYAIIQNGIRLSGMPAWGAEHGRDDESWALVWFIRHLPKVNRDELREMEKLNPKGPGERAEQQEEENFLEGTGDAPAPGMPEKPGMKH